MLTWLYDLFTSFVTFILGFFGMDIKKKSVSFAEDTKEGAVEISTVTHTKEENSVAADVTLAEAV